ncbi:MAG: beta-lactamase family protein, partial [Candidatus Eremiobacteraeota bacterium]|nr:beta-lactamase family protein [Candidatus Eremiobacteraeota bacterium]
RSYGARFDGKSSFEIGSITKTFTATLFADMVVRDEVKPDDPIDLYLPPGTIAPAFGGHRITLIDLATQSSGLPRMPTNFKPTNARDPYADYDDSKLLAFLRAYPLPRAPGATFEYSNLGFGLLGYLLARRLGVDYATAIRTRILNPLGMTHTVIPPAGAPVETVRGHDIDGDPTSNWTLAALAGAGAVVSTADDMLRFARANLDESGPLAAAMQLAHRPLREAEPGSRIGYAWLTNADGIVWHNGGTGGFRSFIGLDGARGRAVVVLANEFSDRVDALGFHALDPNVPLPPAPLPDVPIDPAVAATYVGRYRFSDGSIATISEDRRGLVVDFDMPEFRARLHARSESRFTIRLAAIDITFRATRPIGMEVAQPGSPPELGTRLP